METERHAVFDYNGTLGVAVDFWGDMDEHFGIPPRKSREMLEKFREGEITDEEFDEWRIRKYNQSQEDSSREGIEKFYTDYFQRNGLRPGAEELVDLLREEGFRIHLLSHAPDGYVKNAAEELGVDVHVETACIIAGEKVEDIKWKLYDKSEYIRGLEGEIWFYGDGHGDFEAAEKADRGFLVENMDEADYSGLEAYTGSFEQLKKKTGELVGVNG